MAHLLFLYLLVVEPLVGRAVYHRFLGRVGSDPAARPSYYLLVIGWEWALVLLLALVAWRLGIAPRALGFALPHASPLVSGALVGVGVGMVLSVLGARSARGRERLAKQLGAVAEMLPRTGRERGLWILLSATAGACEELLFRGFLIWYLGAAWALPLWGAVAAAALVFGLAHAYQGIGGMVVTSALGALLGVLYGLTGSLAWPVAVHFLVDARILALPAPAAMPSNRS